VKRSSANRRFARCDFGGWARTMGFGVVFGATLIYGARANFNPGAYPAIVTSGVLGLGAKLEEVCARPFDYLSSPSRPAD
jgi:hypothetical protein